MDIHISTTINRGKQTAAPGILGAFGVTKADEGSEEIAVMINGISDINTLHEASLAASSAIVRVVERSTFLPAYVEPAEAEPDADEKGDDTAPDPQVF